MKTIIIALLLLFTATAEAAPIATILFDEGEPSNPLTTATPWPGHYLWTGAFDLATPFGFSALIGHCQNPINCIYNDPLEGFNGFITNSTIGFASRQLRT